jgi:hypothetical protein
MQAVHQLQQWDTAARIQNCPSIHNFVCEGVHVYKLGLILKWNILYNGTQHLCYRKTLYFCR